MRILQSNSSNMVISLVDAVNNESLRQDFLFQLDLNITYCEGVIYDPEANQSKSFFLDILNNLETPINQRIIQQFNQDHTRKKDFHTQIPFNPYFFLLDKKLPLFVGTKFFSGEYNKEEVCHALVAHEGRHLEQLSIGFPYFDNHSIKEDWINGEINSIMMGCIAEVDANYHSLLSIQNNDFQVRDIYKRVILDRYKTGIVSLYGFEFSSKNNKEKEIIRTILNSVIIK